MFDKAEKPGEKFDTIQDIAVKLVENQLKTLQLENMPKERTIFILGSKGVGKSTAIYKFFDRDEQPRPTLALEYSYGKRSSATHHLQKQVLNMWELGSLENALQLIEVPLRTHGLKNFAAIIMLDLSQPQRLWLELETAYNGLKETAQHMIITPEDIQYFRERSMERIKKDHNDLITLDLLPLPVIIVGGKYDLFMEFDSELKKHICRCLRSMAHLIGASLLFHSIKIPKLAKTLRDTISHLGFASPTNPFRSHITDHNDSLSIWFGTDSWEHIGVSALNMELIAANIKAEIPQSQNYSKEDSTLIVNPIKDPGFQESIIDEMRAQKDEELKLIVQNSQLRGQFENVIE